HAFERVFLQQQIGSSDDWRTLGSTFLGAGSHYTLAYRWRHPGTHDVRILIRRAVRNLAGASDPGPADIQPAQVPGFTTNSADPGSPYGGALSGRPRRGHHAGELVERHRR